LVGIAHWSELGQSNDAYQMIFTTHPPPEHKAPGLEQREWGLKKLSPHNVPLLSLSSPLPNGRAPSPLLSLGVEYLKVLISRAP